MSKKFYRIAPWGTFGKSSSGKASIGDALQTYEFEYPGVKDESFYDAFALLSVGCSGDDVFTLLTQPIGEVLLRGLQAKGLILEVSEQWDPSDSFAPNISYLSGLSDFPVSLQNQLSKIRAIIIGVGGIGQAIIQHLLGFGIRRFVLIDDDIVASSNFNRQFCVKWKQIGQLKIESVRTYIQEYTSDAEVICIRKRILYPDDLNDLSVHPDEDFLFGCADHPPSLIQDIITNIALKKGLPVSFASVGYHTGSWGPTLMDHQGKEEFLSYLRSKESLQGKEGWAPIPASLGTTNSIMAALCVDDVVRAYVALPGCRSLNARKRINFATLKQTSVWESPYSCHL